MIGDCVRILAPQTVDQLISPNSICNVDLNRLLNADGTSNLPFYIRPIAIEPIMRGTKDVPLQALCIPRRSGPHLSSSRGRLRRALVS